jgi:hypothetical protein
MEFANIRDQAVRTGVVDLKKVKFLTPTTILPLSIMLRTERHLTLVPPPNPDVENYLWCMMKDHGYDTLNKSTYLPVVGLPHNEELSQPILKKVYGLAGDPGGKNAFRYLVGELVDNIYQHSRFANALIMAQQYKRNGDMHLCIIDDGITIAGSLRESGMSLDDDQAIVDAIEGASSKMEKERGRGLGTTMNLTLKGYGGSMLVVSGQGAIYCDGDNQSRYRLSDTNKYKGTLISMKIPLTLEEVDLYEHTSL